MRVFRRRLRASTSAGVSSRGAASACLPLRPFLLAASSARRPASLAAISLAVGLCGAAVGGASLATGAAPFTGAAGFAGAGAACLPLTGLAGALTCACGLAAAGLAAGLACCWGFGASFLATGFVLLAGTFFT